MSFVAVPYKRPWTIVLLIALPLVVSCRTEYTAQYFSFPPGSKPHEDDWQYTARVTVASNHTPITDRSRKKVNITVFDKKKDVLLNEDLRFESASIRANIAWEDFEELTIELLEVGNEYAEDDYNRWLVKTGPNKLLVVRYKYDRGHNSFKKAL